MAAKKVLKVTAPLVQVTIGTRAVQLYEGDLVPLDASEESIDHLKDLGYVDEGDAPKDADPALDPAPADPAANTEDGPKSKPVKQ